MRLFTAIVAAVVVFGSALVLTPASADTSRDKVEGLLELDYEKGKETLSAYQVRLYERVRKLKKKQLEIQRIQIGGLILVLASMAAMAMYLGRELKRLGRNPEHPSPPVPEEKKHSRWKRPLKFLLLAVFSFSVYLLTMELAARAYYVVSGTGKYLERWTFRATQPPPYQGASYFSKDFVLEAKYAIQISEVPGTSIIRHDDFSGRNSNVKGGRRVTTGQPAAFRNRIWVFGGSTVFGTTVPDAMTVPSYLQNLVNDASPGQWRVENLGTISMNASQQFERLRLENISENDIVVFFDGANDIVYSLYYRSRDGWRLGEDLSKGFLMMSKRHKFFLSVYWRFAKYSDLIRLTYNLYGSGWRPSTAFIDGLRERVPGLEDDYYNALVETHRYLKTRDAQFFHFLQPTLFSRKNETPYEAQLKKDFQNVPRGYDQAFQVGYPALRKVLARLRERGISTHDLSDILDDAVARHGEVYLDFAHMNHVANAYIANKIFEIINESIVQR